MMTLKQKKSVSHMGTTFLNIINKSVFYLFLFQVCVKALYLTLGTLGPAVVSNFVSPLFPQDFLPPPICTLPRKAKKPCVSGPLPSPPARPPCNFPGEIPLAHLHFPKSRIPPFASNFERGEKRRGELRRRVINLEQVLLDLVAGKKDYFVFPFPLREDTCLQKKNIRSLPSSQLSWGASHPAFINILSGGKCRRKKSCQKSISRLFLSLLFFEK